MTIEILKSESLKLSRFEKLEFLKFLADLLATEDTTVEISGEDKQTLLKRSKEIKSGTVKTLSATAVKNKLSKKYGLQS